MSGIAWAASRMLRVSVRKQEDFLCVPKLVCLATLFYHRAVHSLKFMMSNSNGENVNDRCPVCAFVVVNKKRKRIIDGDFLKKFESL